MFTGHALSALGDAMAPVAIAFAVIGLTGKASDLGLVLTANVVPFVALALLGGTLADRFERRRLMIAADLLRFSAQGASAGLVLAGDLELWHLVVLQALAGAGSAFFWPAAVGLLPMAVEPARLQDANALRSLAQAGMGIGGQALSGVLVATAGAGPSLAVDAATFLASAGCLAMLRLPGQAHAPAQSIGRDLIDGWRELRSRTWLWIMVTTGGVQNALSAAFSVLGPIVAASRLGGASAWGAVLAAGSAGSLLGGLVSLRVRPKRPVLFGTLILALWPLGDFALAGGAPLPVVALASFAAGVGLMTFNTLWETTLQQQIPAHALSRVSSYDVVGSLALRAAGFAVVGPIAAGIGVEETLYLAGAATLALLCVDLAVPSVRRLERTE